MDTRKRPQSIDLAHHLSEVARRRNVSPLKGLQKYFSREGLIPLAGGMPSPAYFPFVNIGADAMTSASFPLDATHPSSADSSSLVDWLLSFIGSPHLESDRTVHISVPKTPSAEDGGLNLAAALQYADATGMRPLRKFIQEWTELVYRPGFEDFTTLVHSGNTDGWSRIVTTLCNPGEIIITEEWTYPSAMVSARPFGIGVLPVSMDGQGMRADSLRDTLASWDERKGKRPHVLYTVPVGQNPSGATLEYDRRKTIYDVCVQFDVVIVEDDPYYFLQLGEYAPKSAQNDKTQNGGKQWDDNQQFLQGLLPSFLNFDYQGRVIRLDTFSKTIAPGVRLGWFTCNPLFANRLERHGETTVQNPCGLGQSLVIKLLQTWGFDGYTRWIRGLNAQYKRRRDFFCDRLTEEFDFDETIGAKDQGVWSGKTVLTAYAKRAVLSDEKVSREPLFGFVPPSSGMYLWVKIYFNSRRSLNSPNDDEESLERQFWIKLVEAGVLTSPGWFFSAEEDSGPTDPNVEGHIRISYSQATDEDMTKAVSIFSDELKKFLLQI